MNLSSDGVLAFPGVFFNDFGVFDGVLLEFSLKELRSGVDGAELERRRSVDFLCHRGAGPRLTGASSLRRLFTSVSKLKCDIFSQKHELKLPHKLLSYLVRFSLFLRRVKFVQIERTRCFPCTCLWLVNCKNTSCDWLSPWHSQTADRSDIVMTTTYWLPVPSHTNHSDFTRKWRCGIWEWFCYFVWEEV